MATLQEITSKEIEITSLGNHTTMSYEKLPAKNIISDMPVFVTTDPIDSKRISKELTNSLTKSSVVKAGLVFLGTVGTYYLAKTTNILSYFGWGTKNSKDKGNSEIMEVKNKANVLDVRRNLETARQANNPSINRIAQTYKTEDSTIEFKEIKVEEFENFQKIEKQENLGVQKSFSRRSINIQNSIPDQNATAGKLFELTIDGNDVFSSSTTLSLEAINIPDWLMVTSSNPNPAFKSSYDTRNWASDVTLSGNYAYTAIQNSLQIIDISNPTNPTFKGEYNTPGNAFEVAVSGNYAYVADGDVGLLIIDISNPSNPTFKGSYNTPRQTEGVAISGNYAYLVGMGSGLEIIDISNPSNPTFKGSCAMSSWATKVAVFENYAHVAANSGLNIIDISNPSNPTFKGSYDMLDDAQGIALSGNYAYVANKGLGLQIIDISDPTNPTFKGSYNTPDSAREVAVSSNYAYVADAFSGLQIIDISNLENPTFKNLYNTPGKACGVAVSGNYAYVADGDSNSLQIIALNSDKIILLGTPNFAGIYDIDIEACNEIMECVTDSFNIVVKGFDDTTDTVSTDTEDTIDDTTDTISVTGTTDLTNSIAIISSMTVAVCVACIASFSLPLIIGAVIVMSKRNRNKILGNEDNAKEKELKEIKELKK